MLKVLINAFTLKSFPLTWPGHWIDGQWMEVKSNEKVVEQSINPNDGKLLVSVSGSVEASECAIGSSVESKFFWDSLAKEERMRLMKEFATILIKHQKLLINALQIESGRPAWDAQEEVKSSLMYLEFVEKQFSHYEKYRTSEYFIDHSKHSLDLRFTSRGVVASYVPFSNPVSSLLMMISSAILSSSPLVVFSSNHSVLVCGIIASLLERIEFPKGFVNFVFGGFDLFKKSIKDKRIGVVHYAGSFDHCQEIANNNEYYARPLLLTSGGKNVVVVHSSADLKKAVKATVYGLIKSCGQLCSSTSRVFIYRSLMSDFRVLLKEAMDALIVGPTDDFADYHGPSLGPLYSKKALDKFLRFQTMANREALETLFWGREIEHPRGGFFVSPGVHLFEKLDSASVYQSNVLCLPDLALYPYDVLEEVIQNINTSDFICSVAFFGDKKILEDRALLFRAPNLLHNAPTVELEAQLPLVGSSLATLHTKNGIGLAHYMSKPQVVLSNVKNSFGLS